MLLALLIVEYVLYGHSLNVLSFICFRSKIQSYQLDDVKVVHVLYTSQAQHCLLVGNGASIFACH